MPPTKFLLRGIGTPPYSRAKARQRVGPQAQNDEAFRFLQKFCSSSAHKSPIKPYRSLSCNCSRNQAARESRPSRDGLNGGEPRMWLIRHAARGPTGEFVMLVTFLAVVATIYLLSVGIILSWAARPCVANPAQIAADGGESAERAPCRWRRSALSAWPTRISSSPTGRRLRPSPCRPPKSPPAPRPSASCTSATRTARFPNAPRGPPAGHDRRPQT